MELLLLNYYYGIITIIKYYGIIWNRFWLELFSCFLDFYYVSFMLHVKNILLKNVVIIGTDLYNNFVWFVLFCLTKIIIYRMLKLIVRTLKFFYQSIAYHVWSSYVIIW